MTFAVMADYAFNAALARAADKGIFQNTSACSALEKRRRWVNVTMVNQSEFKIEPVQNWFDSGKFWTAPGTCNAMTSLVFTGCEKDSSFFTGVSGAILYDIVIGQQCFPLTVAFSNPQIGATKCRAEFSPDFKAVWHRMDSGNPYYSPVMSIGCFQDHEGRRVDINLRVVSIPGQNARVEVREGREY